MIKVFDVDLERSLEQAYESSTRVGKWVYPREVISSLGRKATITDMRRLVTHMFV